MPRRKPRLDKYSHTGSILDCPPAIDPRSWAEDNILATAKAPKPPEACHCAAHAHNRLGGCEPGLRWAEPGIKLEACCFTCGKPLIKGVNKRREQVLMIGLAAAPIDHLDLADLRACRWLRGWEAVRRG